MAMDICVKNSASWNVLGRGRRRKRRTSRPELHECRVDGYPLHSDVFVGEEGDVSMCHYAQDND